MGKSLLTKFLVTSCLGLATYSTIVMAHLDPQEPPRSPRLMHHKRQDALVERPDTKEIRVQKQRKDLYEEAEEANAKGLYATARKKAIELSKIGGSAKAQQILAEQQKKFSAQATRIDYKLPSTPTTQPLLQILSVKDRPTADTGYTRKAKAQYKGVLKRTGLDPEKVTAEVSFLSALSWEQALEAEKARKKPRVKRLQELEKETLELYMEASEAGNTRALNNMALFLLKKGYPEQAEPLLREAAKKRKTLALNNLGEFLEAQRQFEEAEKAYKTAANNGCIQAQYNLAMLYLNNEDYKAAKSLLKKLNKNEKLATKVKDGKTYYRLSETGLDPALAEMAASVKYSLAGIMVREKGFTKSVQELLEDVANGDNSLSGYAHYRLFKELRRTDAEAAYQHVKSAAKEGLVHAQVDYGLLLAQKGKTRMAITQLGKAAKKGDRYAARYIVPLLGEMKESLAPAA